MRDILDDIDGLAFVELDRGDVVRHRIVQDIVHAYERRGCFEGVIAVTRAVQVFGADEQSAVPVDVLRWVRLAELVLDEERVPADAEMSVLFVDEDTIADLNERFLDGTGPTDVLAFPLDDDRSPAAATPTRAAGAPGRRPSDDEPPIVLGDVVVCPAVAAAPGGIARASRSTTSSRSSSCTACCTCSTTTTPSPTTPSDAATRADLLSSLERRSAGSRRHRARPADRAPDRSQRRPAHRGGERRWPRATG